MFCQNYPSFSIHRRCLVESALTYIDQASFILMFTFRVQCEKFVFRTLAAWPDLGFLLISPDLDCLTWTACGLVLVLLSRRLDGKCCSLGIVTHSSYNYSIHQVFLLLVRVLDNNVSGSFVDEVQDNLRFGTGGVCCCWLLFSHSLTVFTTYLQYTRSTINFLWTRDTMNVYL